MAKYSTERLTDESERLRQSLLWLYGREFPPGNLPCIHCGHDIMDHHGEDDGAAAVCMFPQSRGAPHVLCWCQDFLPPALEDMNAYQ